MQDRQLARLAEAADRSELRQLVDLYGRAIDRRDFTLLRSLYWDDATEEHGNMFRGTADEYVSWVEGALAMNEMTVHYAVNTLFALDGDYAEGEVCKVSYHRLTGDPKTGDPVREVTTGSRSLDRYARRNGVWKFLHRYVVLDWAEQRDADTSAYASFAANSPPGRVDGEDASFTRLRFFRPGSFGAYRPD